MLFNSFHFLIFFPVVFFLYFALPRQLKNLLLLAASFYFYMAWKPEYIVLILVSALTSYIIAIYLQKTERQGTRHVLLGISIATNLLILFTFKYFNFFISTANDVSTLFGGGTSSIIHNLILPLGISFYTFQIISYVIDVHRAKLGAERNFFKYLLYIMFFPQLVAGPIERAPHLLGQFNGTHTFDYQQITGGLKLAAWGMFKKVVIADRLAVFVDYVYQSPESFTGMPLILATVFFAFQIYCDFSGYSDIAIGTAQTLGFNLRDNFRRPYAAKSIGEFWSRWHISLSTWFRDYVYIPLGGNRVGTGKLYINIFLTFLISGVWHGAAWTFVAWGALHGFYLIASRLTEDIRAQGVCLFRLYKVPTLHAYLQIVTTFFLTCVAWVLFLAQTMRDAVYIFTHSLQGIGEWFYNIAVWNTAYLNEFVFLGQDKRELLIVVLALAFMEFVHIIQPHTHIRHMFSAYRWFVRWPLYVTIIFFLLVFGKFGERQFIYFIF